MKKNEIKERVKSYFDSCKPFKCMGELLDGARLYDLKKKIYLQLGGRYAITKDCDLAYDNPKLYENIDVVVDNHLRSLNVGFDRLDSRMNEDFYHATWRKISHKRFIKWALEKNHILYDTNSGMAAKVIKYDDPKDGYAIVIPDSVFDYNVLPWDEFKRYNLVEVVDDCNFVLTDKDGNTMAFAALDKTEINFN